MPVNANRLSDHAAIVTGASSGIGMAVAEVLAREGAAVVVNHRSHHQVADEIVGRIEAVGGRAVAIQADVSREEDFIWLFDETMSTFGRVDVLARTLAFKEMPE